MSDSLITRLNQLTAISRQRELTTQEQEERDRLRNEYRQRTRENLRQQLQEIKPEKK